jgi:NADH-quinone oxidoreductase subunit L
MVTAGVYMVARFSFLYIDTPEIGTMIAYIGAITALIAAIIATKQDDIKKILAYSTMSQLGYMFVAVGVGAYSSGLFHVFTHAFFKALLFLGAGAVIFALHHEQNIWKMGNLKKIKGIYIPMFIATLAIAGIPPFAGFFSKDEILLKTYASGHLGLYIILLFTAFLTAYYMFRLFFVTFHGNNRSYHHIEMPPFAMTVVLKILAFFAIIAGFFGLPEVFGGDNEFAKWLSHSLSYNLSNMSEVSHSLEFKLMFFGVSASLIGIFIAYKRFYNYGEYKPSENLITTFVKRKLFVDEVYEFMFVRSLKNLSRFLLEVLDEFIISKSINLSARGVTLVSRMIGGVIQNGYIRIYLLYVILAISLMAMFLEKFV